MLAVFMLAIVSGDAVPSGSGFLLGLGTLSVGAGSLTQSRAPAAKPRTRRPQAYQAPR
jgi:hypothetical protein